MYRIAVDGRYNTAVSTLQVSEAEKRGAEKQWLKVFERYTQHKDTVNQQTALELALATPGDHAETVELLQSADTRIALRAWQLEQMAAKAAPTLCVQGCGFSDRYDRIEHHEINECPKRIMGCELCGQQLPLEHMEAHQEIQCPNRLVLCCHLGRGCTEAVPAERIEVHERRLCRYRDVTCRVPCDAVMQFRHRDQHEQEKCPNRSVPCPLGCGLWVRAIDERSHVANDCDMRLVPCRIGCHRTDLPFKEREAHEQEVCVRPCRWEGCVRRLGPLHVREVHEKFLCPRRTIACPLQCGAVGLVACYREAHVERQCSRRLLPCRMGCGATLLACEMEMHLDADIGSCPERMRRCPLDIVRVDGREGRRIEVETSPGVYIYCSIRAFNRKEQAFKLTYPDTVHWQALADLSYKFVDNAPQSWVCGWVPAGAMDRHLDSECTLRSEACPMHCGQVLFVGKMPVHLAACPRRLEPCPLQCGRTLEARFLHDHVAVECDQREIMCQKCGSWGIKERAMYLHWKEECTMLEVRCGQGCGAYVPRKHLNRHESSECGKRPGQCPDCGRTDAIWAEELPAHLANECPKRQVFCQLGCKEEMMECFREDHEKHICPRRVLPCESCGASMMQQDIADHKVLDCPGFLRSCPAGCGARVRNNDLEKHQKEECAKRHAAAGGVLMCPLGCGKELTYLEQFVHVSIECERRVLDCSWGCGQMLAKYKHEEHMLTCPNRRLPCGQGCASCGRELRTWLVPTAELLRGRHAHTKATLAHKVTEQTVLMAQYEAMVGPALEFERPPLEAKVAHHRALKEGLEAQAAAAAGAALDLDGWLAEEGVKGLKLELVRCDLHASTALIRAAARGEPSVVGELVHRLRVSGLSRAEVTAQLNHAQRDGHSALTKACSVGDLNMVRLLLREGASIDHETHNGRTALIECAKHGHVEPLRFLVEEGALLEKVSKQKTTAFDWALNSGQLRALRHLVREYRVQMDLKRVFRLILAGDIRAVRKIILPGQPYHQNARGFIEAEIAACDEEVEECEVIINELVADLAVKEPQLARYLELEAAELEHVGGLQDVANSHHDEGEEMVARMTREYDDAMVFLTTLEKSDLSEVTDVAGPRFVPPAARRIIEAMCRLLGLSPKVTVDERVKRYGGRPKKSKKALRLEAKKAKAKAERNRYKTRRDVYGSRVSRNSNDDDDDDDDDDDGNDDEDDDEDGGASLGDESNESSVEGEGAGSDGVAAGTIVDWWGAGVAFLRKPNCVNNLRFVNKSALTAETLDAVRSVAGKRGSGIAWGWRERIAKNRDDRFDPDDDETASAASSRRSSSSSFGRGAAGQHRQPRASQALPALPVVAEVGVTEDSGSVTGGSESFAETNSFGKAAPVSRARDSVSSGGVGDSWLGLDEDSVGASVLTDNEAGSMGLTSPGQAAGEQLWVDGTTGEVHRGDDGEPELVYLDVATGGLQPLGSEKEQPPWLRRGPYADDGAEWVVDEETGEARHPSDDSKDPERPWKAIEAISKWIRAVMAYHEAAMLHNRIKEKEFQDMLNYEASIPGLEKAQYFVRIARFGVGLVRRELTELRNHVAYLNKNISGAEERMRVAKMMQTVDKSGHTLVSWAAVSNQPEILELLFDHGGAPGYTDEVYTLCATIVQLVFRNYWWVGHRGPYAPSLAVEWRERSLKTQFALTDAITKLKYFKARNRLPLTEACYNGHHRILDVFKKKGVPMIHASRTWIRPMPMTPFVVPPRHLIKTPLAAMLALDDAPEGEGVGVSDAAPGEAGFGLLEEAKTETQLAMEAAADVKFGKKGALQKENAEAAKEAKAKPRGVINMYDAAMMGFEERGCDEFVLGHGWVEATHEASTWSITIDKAKLWMDRIDNAVKGGILEKKRRRRMREAKIELTRQEGIMEDLLTAGVTDFNVRGKGALVHSAGSCRECGALKAHGYPCLFSPSPQRLPFPVLCWSLLCLFFPRRFS